jgi:hypothetical protein
MIQVITLRLFRTELKTRMPFKYGIATMIDLPHVLMQVTLAIDGRIHEGISADHLPPKWFTKDPTKGVADEIRELERVIAQAAALAQGLQAGTVFDLWLQLHRRMERWRKETALPPLLVHFGTSLVERGMIDAFCRATGVSFARAVHRGGFGIRLAEIHPELCDFQPDDLLPVEARRDLVVRHTVGLADPIDASDRASAIADGLPETLEENISAYGLRHFKIKFTGLADLPRLGRILETIAAAKSPEVGFTLDGNESFRSVAEFRGMWSAIESLSRWPAMRDGLICVEQPFHREVALSDGTTVGLKSWAERPPLIIDESDAEFDSVRLALDGGYAGTSHKNCKGVFRGIANACLLGLRRRVQPERVFLQTGEDLANVGPVALLQDLAVQSVLGVESVERNGHHYFRGLSFLPAEVQAQMLAAHSDLYRRHERGFATLAIRRGMLQVGSVVDAPFGVGYTVDLAAIADQYS